MLYEYPYTEVHEGVALYDISEGIWRDFTEREVAVCDWNIDMESAPNGDVWFCTWDGVARYSQGPK